MLQQPLADRRDLVRGVVVQDQVQVQVLGTAASMTFRNRRNSWCRSGPVLLVTYRPLVALNCNAILLNTVNSCFTSHSQTMWSKKKIAIAANSAWRAPEMSYLSSIIELEGE
jgi:hypothetical protein